MVQGFDDVWFHYYSYVGFYIKGWNPYAHTGLSRDTISTFYNYGPLFIILISLGSQFLGLSIYNSILFSNIIFDSMSVVILYLIIKRDHPRFALGISLTYAFSPLSFIYMNIYLLNMPHMIFFILLFIYFDRDKAEYAMIALAMGFAIKLIPILILPVSLFYHLHREGVRYAIKLGFIFTIYAILPFIPFLIDDSDAVIAQIISTGDSTSFLADYWAFFVLIIAILIAMQLLGSQWSNNPRLYYQLQTFYVIALHIVFPPLRIRLFKYYYTLIFAYMLVTLLPEKGTESWRIIVYISGFIFFSLAVISLPIHGILSFWTLRWLYPIVFLLFVLYDMWRRKGMNHEL